MTPLHRRLLRRIAQSGPISVADFMADCLLDPDHGYYTQAEPFGTKGDFVTAPEVSQMFGELVGLWLAQVWMDQGAPTPFCLAELGPGRGTLMADLLRATRGVPGFHAGLRLHLVEASPRLRAAQKSALSAYDPTFHDHLADLPDAPLFLIANEFFDALPIRQFQRSEGGWRERQIGIDGDRLIWGLGPEEQIAALADRLADTAPGQIVELNVAARPLAQDIGARIAAHGGAALIVDYGDWESRGDTFQALRGHDFADPLATAGQADLTAHLAFGPLAREAAPARASALTPQGVFLERLGIAARAEALARGLSGEALQSHLAAHRRLTHPDEMGNLFKVIALTPKDAPQPPALEPGTDP